jgi:hypothetical protein
MKHVSFTSLLPFRTEFAALPQFRDNPNPGEPIDVSVAVELTSETDSLPDRNDRGNVAVRSWTAEITECAWWDESSGAMRDITHLLRKAELSRLTEKALDRGMEVEV